jgi:2-polyprenyl-3-methyl-5-hydroxy-6-metoxy-1,4-benzoquinol methylase
MDIISRIKQKKELSGIPDSIVKVALDKRMPKKDLKENDLKLIIKEVRSDLRRQTGMFEVSLKTKKNANLDNIRSLLRSHSSTKERLEFYPNLRKIISGLNVRSILDIGCGINPIAIASRDYLYYASDINNDSLSIVSSFFEKEKISGKVSNADISDKLHKFPEADLILIFKVLDLIENKVNLTEHLLKSLKFNYLLISFPTITLSGKPMNHKRRYWLERILSKQDYNFSTFSSKNELFYLVSKQ